MKYFQLKFKHDHLVVHAQKSMQLSTSIENTKRVYEDLLKSSRPIIKVSVIGINPHSLSIKEEIIDKDIKLRYLEIRDDPYGMHLKTILNLIVPDSNTNICLPNHFELFDNNGSILDSNRILNVFDSQKDFCNSAMLFVVGQGYDENFKNPVKILGLTQLKLSV